MPLQLSARNRQFLLKDTIPAEIKSQPVVSTDFGSKSGVTWL
jgi:hypothetical protein